MPVSLEPVPVQGALTPAQAFAALADEPHAFWLDAGLGASNGWSFVGAGALAQPDEVSRTPLAETATSTELPSLLYGGWVGWESWEAGASRAGAPVHLTPDAAPARRWITVERVIGFHHDTGVAYISADDPHEWLTAAQQAAAAEAVEPSASDAGRPAANAIARVEPAEYARRVTSCRAAIRAGDAYQLCLTTRFEVAGTFDPAQVHRRLRATASAHHGACIRSAEYALIGASPELFLAVRDGIVRTSPIKGTRPRGRTPAEDAELRRELADSAKEQAENVMIVDLMRNDLATVCEVGSVSVERLREVESYPTVHQLVSTVAGRILPGTTVGHLLRAAFPAGSMSGAPKLSAMQLLHRIEGAPRGVYAGCAGWVGRDGALDLAMVIRTVIVHPGGAYVGSGGGITWHSVPEDEVAEVGVKAKAPLAALGVDVPTGW